MDRSSHLLDKTLADAKSKADAVAIKACVFLQFAKIHKKLLSALLGHSATEVPYDEVERNVKLLRLLIGVDLLVSFSFLDWLILGLKLVHYEGNMDFRVRVRKLNRVVKEVY